MQKSSDIVTNFLSSITSNETRSTWKYFNDPPTCLSETYITGSLELNKHVPTSLLEVFRKEYPSLGDLVVDLFALIKVFYVSAFKDGSSLKKIKRFEHIIKQKINLLARADRRNIFEKFSEGQKPTTDPYARIFGGVTNYQFDLEGHGLLDEARDDIEEIRKKLQEKEDEARKLREENEAVELEKWDTEHYADVCFMLDACWELPQTGLLLQLLAKPLRLQPFLMHEFERCLVHPYESLLFSSIMTSLLATENQRLKVDLTSRNHFKWENRLRQRLTFLYSTLSTVGNDTQQAAEILGADDDFFDILGPTSPLNKPELSRPLDHLTWYQRLHIVKYLLEAAMMTQASLRECLDAEDGDLTRPYLLGIDHDGNRYLHFYQFRDLKIYKEPSFDNTSKKNSTSKNNTTPAAPQQKSRIRQSHNGQQKSRSAAQKTNSTSIGDEPVIFKDLFSHTGTSSRRKSKRLAGQNSTISDTEDNNADMDEKDLSFDGFSDTDNDELEDNFARAQSLFQAAEDDIEKEKRDAWALPEETNFRLVANSIESLTELIAGLSAHVSRPTTRKRKSARKPVEINSALVDRLSALLEELQPLSGKLKNDLRIARGRLKSDLETYVEPQPEPVVNEASQDAEEDADDAGEMIFDVSSFGRIRKRRVIPGAVLTPVSVASQSPAVSSPPSPAPASEADREVVEKDTDVTMETAETEKLVNSSVVTQNSCQNVFNDIGPEKVFKPIDTSTSVGFRSSQFYTAEENSGASKPSTTTLQQVIQMACKKPFKAYEFSSETLQSTEKEENSLKTPNTIITIRPAIIPMPTLLNACTSAGSETKTCSSAFTSGSQNTVISQIQRTVVSTRHELPKVTPVGNVAASAPTQIIYSLPAVPVSSLLGSRSVTSLPVSSTSDLSTALANGSWNSVCQRIVTTSKPPQLSLLQSLASQQQRRTVLVPLGSFNLTPPTQKHS